MTETPIASAVYIVAGAEGQVPYVNAAFNRLEQLAQLTVENLTISSTPASASAGVAYIVASGATGAFSTHANDVAVYYSGWLYMKPRDGWQAYDKDTGQVVVFDGTVWSASAGGAYDVLMSKAGIPTTSEVVTVIPCVRNVFFDADFAGSLGDVQTAPTSTLNIDVKDDGVSIGTISVSTTGAFTFTTVSNVSKTVASGSILTFVAPATPDATGAGISATMKGRVV